jgi:hypothetical protein
MRIEVNNKIPKLGPMVMVVTIHCYRVGMCFMYA